MIKIQEQLSTDGEMDCLRRVEIRKLSAEFSYFWLCRGSGRETWGESWICGITHGFA